MQTAQTVDSNLGNENVFMTKTEQMLKRVATLVGC